MSDNCMDQSLNNGEIAGSNSVDVRKAFDFIGHKSVLKAGVRAVWYSKQRAKMVSILLD